MDVISRPVDYLNRDKFIELHEIIHKYQQNGIMDNLILMIANNPSLISEYRQRTYQKLSALGYTGKRSNIKLYMENGDGKIDHTSGKLPMRIIESFTDSYRDDSQIVISCPLHLVFYHHCLDENPQTNSVIVMNSSLMIEGYRTNALSAKLFSK